MALSDHFAMNPSFTWIPRVWESMMVDEYNPTYGSSHGTRDVYHCTTCGAVVASPELHAEWHDQVGR